MKIPAPVLLAMAALALALTGCTPAVADPLAGFASPDADPTVASVAAPTSTLVPHPTQSSTPTPRHHQTTPPTQTAPTAMGARQYTIAAGENLFGIAKKFGLKPETVLWANPLTLQDNPNHIKPGMILWIPSVDGLYYRWQAGDTIETVARRYDVDANTIIDWPENAALIGAIDQPTIQPGALLFIPGGKMPLQ